MTATTTAMSPSEMMGCELPQRARLSFLGAVQSHSRSHAEFIFVPMPRPRAELLFPFRKLESPDGPDNRSSRSSSTCELSPIANANLAIQRLRVTTEPLRRTIQSSRFSSHPHVSTFSKCSGSVRWMDGHIPLPMFNVHPRRYICTGCNRILGPQEKAQNWKTSGLEKYLPC